jgi:hypothetical protein
MNDRLARHNLPAISALVVLRTKNGDKGEPGGGFWGCAPNVPPRPKSDVARAGEWAKIMKAVLATKWPAKLPR